MTLPNAQNPSGTEVVSPGSDQQPVIPQPITPAQFTPEQLASLIPVIQEHSRTIAKEAADTAFRGFQSIATRLENSVAAKVKELEKLGISPTPEQKELIRQNVSQEIEQNNAPAGSQPVAQNEPSQGIDPKVIAGMEAIFVANGERLLQGDPEIGMVDESNVDVLFTTLQAAVAAKKERLAKAVALNNPNSVPIVGQRTGRGNSIANTVDIDELYKMARTTN